MTELSVFISYRRDDDAAGAAMLDRIISGAFNEPTKSLKVLIYRDTSERLGVIWPEEVRDRCASANLVLIVIGPRWLEAKDQYARRRIDQIDDWVRQEIELARDRIVIPIAFGGAAIPPAEALPESISYLASRRGITVRDQFVEMDLQPVLAEIERHLPSAKTRGALGDPTGNRRSLPYPDPPLVVKPAPMNEEDIQVDVLVFITEVGDFADKARHHPRWENIYETLRVYITTWDIGHRISHLDIQLAQYFDQVYNQYQESQLIRHL